MKWFLRLPSWVRLSSALTLAAAMFVLIWWMNQKRQAAEDVWHPKARHWTSTPLTVSWDEHFWGAHNNSFSKAVSEINGAVGCNQLRVALDGGPTDVRIVSTDGEPCGDMEALVSKESHAAQTYLCPDGTAEIHIGQPGDVTKSYLIAIHELGHVLGLGHDPYIASGANAPMSVSMMVPNVADYSGRLGTGRRLPAASDKDRRELAKRYCK
ncbi:MAG: hypothetical protein JRG90_12575 [Deltaproteobacteria bacterium]|nr:hypothetical protein [Deltaproteobacteria bacterium]